MSLAHSEAPADSATQTKANEAKARDPKDTGPIDAEVVSETPNPPRAKVARPADVRPLSSVSGDVFGAEVNDTANVKRERPAATPGAEAKGKGKGKKKPVAEPVDANEHEETAAGFVMTADAMFRAYAARRYAPVLEPSSLKQLDEQLALTEAQQAALAKPLAKGLAESGAEVPWWASLALAGGAMYLPKLAALAALDKAREEYDEQEAAKAKRGGA